jgi:hypothetical protein
MWSWERYKNKFIALQHFCEKNNIKFKLIDPIRLSNAKLKELYLNKDIIISKNKIKRFENNLNKYNI